MGRKYSYEFESQPETVEMDAFEITFTNPGTIISMVLTQTTELGDAAEEQVVGKLITGHATGGSGGGADRAGAALDRGNTVADNVTVEDTNTTIASAGTPVDLHTEAFNVRSGWIYKPLPEERFDFVAGDIVVFRIAAPNDEITWCGTLIIEVGN